MAARPQPPTEMFAVRFNQAMLDALRAAARRNGRTTSEEIRRRLLDSLAVDEEVRQAS